MMNRYRFLPSYHYEDNSDGNIQNPATDQLRDYTIHGNHGKNLIPYPYASSAGTQNGVAITIDSDGVITLNGTATATIYFGLLSPVNSAEITKPGKYTISGMPGAVSGVTIQCYVDGAWGSSYVDVGSGKTFTVASSIKFITMQINNGTVCNNVVIKPQLEEGEAATSFERWCGVGDKTINEIPSFSDGTKTESGITFTDNGDGSLTINGTATPKNAYYAVWSRAERVLDKNKTYLLTNETTIPTTDAYMYMELTKSNGTSVATFQISGLGYKIADLSQYDFDIIRINLVANYQKTFDNAVFKPILIDMDEHNLIPYPYANTTKTVNGITITDNGDGSVTFNGTSESQYRVFDMSYNLSLEKGKHYVLTWYPTGVAYSNVQIVLAFRKNGAAVNGGVFVDSGKGVKFSYDGDYDEVWCYITVDEAGAVFDNLTFRPRLIPIDFEPHGYRIPIKNQSETTTIYTTNQVMDGESISFRKNGLPAVKLSQSNQLSVETAVKPSAVEYNYYTY